MDSISSIAAVGRVKEYLRSVSCDACIVHTDDTIFTVEDASRAVGAPPEEILKSLLFRAKTNEGEDWVLALMSGANKVHDKKIKNLLGAKKIRMGASEDIRAFSLFEPGGVPPVGYPKQPMALLDNDLFKYTIVWSAAGSDHDFFPISPDELLRITGGRRADIKK
ncbi:MAG: YbaK/EbsC family protein [Synergistaceae bacterium]|jgi:prolyl-tRNA editing enzyme YbaK/EbsC (Cys-tRNA(Pro) deacylase)|nr:YbaK/EbsC family protein [Synergistaceae bacterium]